MTQQCVRCLYDDTVPRISFDAEGVCSYCRTHDELNRQYPLGEEGLKQLHAILDKIKHEGRNKRYDCVVGVSGGCDSSFMLWKLVEFGMRPLAVHFDNTWNSTIATQNIKRVSEALNVDLFTIVIDNREMDDIYRAMIASGVPDIEAPMDLALAATMRQGAERAGVRYIMQGHSFRTEGISPLGWLYMDHRYIASIHKKYGKRPLRTLPQLTLSRQLKWWLVNGFNEVRPLYYLEYNKEEVKKELAQRFGWEWYGGHHLDNRFTAFFHRYFLPIRFGLDSRILGYSALLRSGQMTREEALAEMRKVPQEEPEIVELAAYVQKRLGYSDNEFASLMRAPKHYWTEFPNYMPTFRRLRPLLWLLMKVHRVPRSFYLKYTGAM